MVDPHIQVAVLDVHMRRYLVVRERILLRTVLVETRWAPSSPAILTPSSLRLRWPI